MRQYVIERAFPGAHTLSPAELQGIARKSVEVLGDLGAGVQWLNTFVAEDKFYCVYHAEDPELIYEHGRGSGFPVDSVRQVSTVIGPSHAEG